MPNLVPGKVYRTKHFKRYGSNATREAKKLVAAGKLRPLQKGLYYSPKMSAFGEVPPSQDELLKARFGGKPYLVTGSSVWNGLGLGSTAVEAMPLVYNGTVTGQHKVGPVRFQFRRVNFPKHPPAEFFVIDLLENHVRAGLDLQVFQRALKHAVEAGRFDGGRLREMASKFGSRSTQELVQAVLA